jgi:hypothetical protein
MPINPLPTDPRIASAQGQMTPVYQAFFSSIKNWLGPVGLSGPTSARPTSAGTSNIFLYIGLEYFDTTLGYPVWVKQLNPLVWVNATGAMV